MKFTQIRHGSHIIEYKNKKFLVDPVLADKGTSSALPMGRVKEKNPLVQLPFDTSFIKEIDVLIITHMHFDHFDQEAMDLLPKRIPIYCHPDDEKKIRKAGFNNVIGIEGKVVFEGMISIEVINGGRHGVGIRGKLMGKTTGYMIKDISQERKEPTAYLIGDSIWCDAVKNALDEHEPEVIIAFAGEARLIGKPITMSTGDLEQIALNNQKANIVVNHMDTWNHCFLTRDKLQKFIENKSYKNRFYIPKDGETILL